MFYEMRVYYCLPGRLPALNKRFADATLKLWDKYGIKQAGFFTDYIGANCNAKLTYFIAWASMAERETKWAAFMADPDWIAARAASEQDGPILERVESSILQPTAYSSVK
jgi:hypothetical protein